MARKKSLILSNLDNLSKRLEKAAQYHMEIPAILNELLNVVYALAAESEEKRGS